MKHKFSSKQASIICYMLIISIIIGLFAYNKITAYGYEEKQGIVVGIQQGSSLNVRDNPGTQNTTVLVQIPNSTLVMVVDERNASDGSLWYKIKFTYGEKNYEGYAHSTYIKIIETVEQTFEEYLTSQGFPESYKPYLRVLHEKYPNWIFKADQLNYTFEEVLNAQSDVIGRSLIASSSKSSWKSTVGAAYNWTTGEWTGYDGPGWVQASRELIAYCLDPRNALDENYIFQFESLAYQPDVHDEVGVQTLINGSFMSSTNLKSGMTYSAAIMEAAIRSQVSPYHLASSMIQELGKITPSVIISGTYPGYEGYYNYYNWGAVTKDGLSAIENGLIYAKSFNDKDPSDMRPWDSQEKAIYGGAIKLGKDYISIGQNTTYYKKFDFVGTPYTHQYMTHILAARLEGQRVSNIYTVDQKRNMPFVFYIPVFKNMPETVAPLPTNDGSPNNALKELSVSAGTLTPSFDSEKPIDTKEFSINVSAAVTSIDINASAYDSKATISGTGRINLETGNNIAVISVKAENGDVREYTVNVFREEGAVPETTYSTSLKTDESLGYLYGVAIGTTASEIKNNFTVTNGTVIITDKNGNEITDKKIGTGDKAIIKDMDGNIKKEYQFILFGDVDGDGVINIKDALLVRKHNLGEKVLTGISLYSANVDRSQDGSVNIKDALIIRKYNLGERTISQD